MRAMPLLSLCLLLAACDASAPRGGTAIVARDETFTCTPVRVWDGDGPVWCAEGPKLRIAGIAAREMEPGSRSGSGYCRPGHPCPAATAEQARDALAALLGGSRGASREGHALVAGPPLTCRSEGAAKGSRTAAWCSLRDGRDLACAMIATGTVERWARFDAEGRLSRC